MRLSISHHSKTGPILHCFGNIADFLLMNPIPPEFWGVPVAPDRPCWGQPAQKPGVNQPSNYFRSIPTCVNNITYLNVTEGRTDGRLTVA